MTDKTLIKKIIIVMKRREGKDKVKLDSSFLLVLYNTLLKMLEFAELAI